MKYYKGTNGELWAYEDDADSSYIAEGLIPISEEEFAELTKPKEPTIEELREAAFLSRADFKLALLEAGYLQDVKDFIASTTDEKIIILWEDSNSFRRMHPDLIRLAEELGYTDAQLDAVFGIA